MLLRTRFDFSSGSDYWTPDVKEIRILNSSDFPGLFDQGSWTLNNPPHVAKTKKAASELGQRDCAIKVEYRPVKFVEEAKRTEGRKLDLLTEEYH